MGLIVKKLEKTAVPPLAGGTYAGVCIGVVDLGEQYNERFKKVQNTVSLTFEIAGETVERGNGPEPRWLSREYTKTLGEKANLTRDLQKLLGEGDLDGFDLRALLGRACLLSVQCRERPDGARFNRVEGLMALPKGMPAPVAASETFLFDMDDPATHAVLPTLPQFLREKVERSPTWARLHAGSEEMDLDEDDAPNEGGAPSRGAAPAPIPSDVDPETGEILRPEDIPF